MYEPCLELNFLICIWHSSRNKQQPLNHWIFLYMAIVLVCKASTTIEHKKRQRALSPIAPSQSAHPCHGVAIPGRERPFLNGSPLAVGFAVPFVQPKQCRVTGDGQLSIDPIHLLFSEGFSPHPLLASALHQSCSQDFIALPSSPPVTDTEQARQNICPDCFILRCTKANQVKTFYFCIPLAVLSLFSASLAPCTTRVGLGGREGPAEARVAGREAEVLQFTRWAWTRLGCIGLSKRRPVGFFLAVSAPALPCRSEHCAAIFPAIKWS